MNKKEKEWKKLEDKIYKTKSLKTDWEIKPVKEKKYRKKPNEQ